MRVPSVPKPSEIARAVNGNLSINDNFDAKIIDVLDTGLANITFTVNHNLGKVPRAYFYNIDRSGIVYDVARASWTETQLTLRCSVNNAALVIVIF